MIRTQIALSNVCGNQRSASGVSLGRLRREMKGMPMLANEVRTRKPDKADCQKAKLSGRLAAG
jgi:hypothetical protein